MVKAVSVVSPGYSVVLKLLAEVTGCLHQLVSLLLLIRGSGGRQLLLILRDITRVSRGRMSRAGCRTAKQMVSAYLNDHITASFDGNKAQRYFKSMFFFANCHLVFISAFCFLPGSAATVRRPVRHVRKCSIFM